MAIDVAAAAPLRADTTSVSRTAGDLGVVAVDAQRADVLAIDAALAAEVAALAADRPALSAVDMDDRQVLTLTATIRGHSAPRRDAEP